MLRHPTLSDNSNSPLCADTIAMSGDAGISVSCLLNTVQGLDWCRPLARNEIYGKVSTSTKRVSIAMNRHRRNVPCTRRRRMSSNFHI